MSQLPGLSFADAVSAVAHVLDAGATPAVVGPPGIGKTSLWRMVSRGLRMPIHLFSSAAYEAVDFIGLPYVEGGCVHRALLSSIEEACREPRLLVFDDFTCVPPSVEGALLRLLLDRSTGERALHPGTRVGVAYNAAEHAPGGAELSAATVSRLVQLRLAPTIAEVSGWFTDAGHADFALVLTQIPHLIEEPGQRALGPWGSPRAWAAGLRAHSYCTHSVTRRAVLAGAVGARAADAYLAVLAVQGLPTFAAIRRAPETVSIPAPKDQIAALATIPGLAAVDIWSAWIYSHRFAAEPRAAAARFLLERTPAASDGPASQQEVLGRSYMRRTLAEIGSAL